MHPFPPQWTSENRDVLRGLEKGCIGNEWVEQFYLRTDDGYEFF